MVLELLVSTSKLIVIFTCLGLFILSLIFKTMSGTMYYYYKRDLDLVGVGPALSDAVAISGKFRPIFRDVKIMPVQSNLLVTSAFSKNSKFKRILPDGKFRYGIIE